MSRIEWVRSNCRLLAAIAAEFRETVPFAGLTIGTGIHLEPKTAALLLVLQRGGADVVSTGTSGGSWPRSPISSSTTAATCSRATLTTRTTD